MHAYNDIYLHTYIKRRMSSSLIEYLINKALCHVCSQSESNKLETYTCVRTK